MEENVSFASIVSCDGVYEAKQIPLTTYAH